ncbi:hypothetical protein SteCoe_23948 [Stentor coeruleus]|uniref:Uncharacterized protein n=1 Tax=Stentor coeruleus TaxID=5963 RepID=A0A1R2BJ61_9CILI|nr:hypothetical protein SteCoe_23948 [Stentor coeruleus]
MVLHPLLKEIPSRFEIPLSPLVQRQFNRHRWMFLFIGGFWALWLIFIPISRFPITFGQEHLETYAMPDYGSGKFYTLFRLKSWRIDNI